MELLKNSGAWLSHNELDNARANLPLSMWMRFRCAWMQAVRSTKWGSFCEFCRMGQLVERWCPVACFTGSGSAMQLCGTLRKTWGPWHFLNCPHHRNRSPSWSISRTKGCRVFMIRASTQSRWLTLCRSRGLRTFTRGTGPYLGDP